ncbi:hypothetical protein MGSAQ_002839, partial [marine sediment metagenome]
RNKPICEGFDKGKFEKSRQLSPTFGATAFWSAAV